MSVINSYSNKCFSLVTDRNAESEGINEFFFFSAEQSATLSLTCQAATLSLNVDCQRIYFNIRTCTLLARSFSSSCERAMACLGETVLAETFARRSQVPQPNAEALFQHELDRRVVLWRVLSEHRVVCSRDF
jgi:hypothetical protein